VVLDLTRVSTVDAGGLGVLVLLQQWARGTGANLQLIPSKPVEDMLELTGLHSLFDIRSSDSVPPASDFLINAREDIRMEIAADD